MSVRKERSTENIESRDSLAIAHVPGNSKSLLGIGLPEARPWSRLESRVAAPHGSHALVKATGMLAAGH